jgi:hypothetical protein
MSAQEIIEQIKSLPPEEKAEVMKFVHQIEAAVHSGDKAQYMDPTTFESAKEKVFTKHSELLNKLAKE